MIFKHIAEEGIKSKVLPLECLVSVKTDICHFEETEDLNEFQKWIVNERYILDLPKLGFQPKSIIIVAVKFKLVHVKFNYGTKSIDDVFCVARKVPKNT